jgi:hypothetical protein
MVELAEKVQWVQESDEKESEERLERGDWLEVKVVIASVRVEEERRKADVERRAVLLKKVEEIRETRDEEVIRTAAS